MSLALVTDSTAYLPAELLQQYRVAVVPLRVACEEREYREGIDLGREELVSILRKGRRLTTSRPSPVVLYEAYERLAAQGATHIVSAHLSGELSGTCDAAELAARSSSVPVTVVDSRSMGMGLGFAVLAGARAIEAGGDAQQVAQVVGDQARRARLLFYVNTLEYLRLGGRIGAASALLGSALAVKPLLCLQSGRIEPVEKLRTAGRAVARLTDLAVQMVESDGHDGPVEVAVHHIDAPERAERLAGTLRERVGGCLGQGAVPVIEIGAVAAAHLGPGALAVVVSPHHE
ncbi:DegV family protein [Gephyromycinifex aptenodytis]|uniref:DegV family protein n=1 Tax=Gephyromycinifex aptenodytis TaxID=2716227 RepID=UPI00144772F8|nr:DegV family protein [Gephyromycinifex aptenodytis]